MAGLGFKVFAVGEVLTAADVDGYLMQQSVMRFADAAARGSALGTAVGTAVALSQGMLSYLDDVDDVQLYSGSVWRSVGKVVAVESVMKTDAFSASVASGASTDVTGLSISHEVSSAGNSLLLTAFFGVAASSLGSHHCGIAIAVGGTLIGIGDASGSRISVGAAAQAPATLTTTTTSYSITIPYTPGAGSKTYTVRAINVDSSTRTLYVNRSEQDLSSADRARGVSGLILMELAP